MQRAHFMTHDRIGQLQRIAMRTRCGDRQTRTDHQRPEELPHRDIEAEGRLLKNRLATLQWIRLLHPRQSIEQRIVTVADALRTAGRA
ncbi:hypothetical protein NOV72_06229 [Caballeronia novacaledonica]|uniref:Uncharacterized protein n=1 Tax=Caballeronia novacaledonica TaxID=1544861 RepID=A0A2U3IFM8_9BURK|nr:hypothetical protein NOV72_06229 [Caballeronia novacaledonica]